MNVRLMMISYFCAVGRATVASPLWPTDTHAQRVSHERARVELAEAVDTRDEPVDSAKP
jgi:hypothetical protein